MSALGQKRTWQRRKRMPLVPKADSTPVEGGGVMLNMSACLAVATQEKAPRVGCVPPDPLGRHDGSHIVSRHSRLRKIHCARPSHE